MTEIVWTYGGFLTSLFLCKTFSGIFLRITMATEGGRRCSHIDGPIFIRKHWQVILLLASFCDSIGAQIRYSIPEEMKVGSLIGNVAQDLGLDLKRLRSGRARIVTGESIQYTELKSDKGILVVSERIDREKLCGEITPCSFSFEIILENPMELHQVTVEILDINDNAPVFRKTEINFEISEIANIGSRFVLGSAHRGFAEEYRHAFKNTLRSTLLGL